MIKLENFEVVGWDAAIRGMRNPMNSWDKSDTDWFYVSDENIEDAANYIEQDSSEPHLYKLIGHNDLDLMMRLRNAGTDHRKFMRMIVVYVDITAPLYWWKEFDTYKVGTVTNSCSTMHKIHEKPFSINDISCDELCKGNLKRLDGGLVAPELKAHYKHMTNILDSLNNLRDLYLKSKPYSEIITEKE